MNRIIKFYIAFGIISGGLSTQVYGQSFTNPETRHFSNADSMKSAFITAPDSIQTSVYWYWLSDNISKEGVVKDLEAMNKAGINRAFIGNIGISDTPYGKVKIFSDQWWDILHTALKTATRLNIQIGIFNSPGWSQSGGPWVKPEMAMRYLTSSSLQVKGPLVIHRKLDRPVEPFQDVRVIAYPVPAGFESDISRLKPMLSSIPARDSLGTLMDQNLQTGLEFKDSVFTLNISVPKPYTVRSLVIVPGQKAMRFDGWLQVKTKNGFKTIKQFSVDRSNPELNVGFLPYGPAAISIPATTATAFRLVLIRKAGNLKIMELKLSSTPRVENFIEKTEAKMWPTPHPFWDAYQWVPQPVLHAPGMVTNPSKVLDISGHMTPDGMLSWKVPAGNWIIERTGMTPTRVKNAPASPEGTGLEVDKMSRKHIAEHFDAYMGEILKRIPAEDRKTWKVTVEDSYETGSQNWTDELIDEFREKYRYDPVAYLPVLQGRVIGSEDQSDRFLWDLRRLIADDVSFKYVGGLREISHKHGLTTWLENYGHWGYPGEFLQYGGQSDEIGGEFWSEGDLGDIENRAASSSAHIYGKTKVSAESFTAAGKPFYRYPAMFKKRGDRFFTEGINNTLLHVYIEQPQDTELPGLNTWFGVEFNRLNTWFKDLDIFLKYSKRCNMMLQQGHYVADVAYFIGEDAPKMTGVQNPSLPQGYSFDYINADVLSTLIRVVDGKLVLPGGIAYSVLVLPKLKTMRPELLSRIQELVHEGATVLGPEPLRSPSLQGYPNADLQVQRMAALLWGSADGLSHKIHRYGKGMVLTGMGLQEALDLIKVLPDARITQTDSVLFIHRELSGSSVYFISNQKNREIDIEPVFRIAGKRPELWNAVTGSIRNLPVFYEHGGTTSVPLKLEPYGSAFIVFKGNRSAVLQMSAASSNFPAPLNTMPLTGPWMVKYDRKSRGPAGPQTFTTLTDWSVDKNDSIRYYSGTAVYRTRFKGEKPEKGLSYLLDLGLVRAMGRVKVNGLDMGGVWTPPYRLDIGHALKAGENTLEIEVVNTWVNRLLGDLLLPVAERKASVRVAPDPKDGLESSGLLGPVKLEVFKY